MLNRVQLIGNVGRPPETRTTDGGRTLTRFSLATNRRWADDRGEPQEQTEWHQVVVFGRLAEIAAKIVDKGRRLYAEAASTPRAGRTRRAASGTSGRRSSPRPFWCSTVVRRTPRPIRLPPPRKPEEQPPRDIATRCF